MKRFLALLTLLALVALAGCEQPAASLEMDAVSDAEMADRASGDVEGLPPEIGGFVARAIENGTATASDSVSPYDPTLPVEYEGAYYNLTYTEIGQENATRYDIRVTRAEGGATGETVAFEDLPATDRDVLAGLLRGPAAETDRPTVGVSRAYTDAEADDSALVPAPDFEYVAYDGDRYRVVVDDARPATITTYRYNATEIAPDAAAFAAVLRDRHLFTLTDLSDAERDIVRQATGDGYDADEVTPAFRSLADRFRANSGVLEDEYGGQYVVRYDGEVYWAYLTTRDPLTDGA